MRFKNTGTLQVTGYKLEEERYRQTLLQKSFGGQSLLHRGFGGQELQVIKKGFEDSRG